jgi:hypothetical protein
MSATPSLVKSPLQEVAERAADAGSGLVAAAHGAAVINMIRSARDYANRVQDAHRMGQQLLATGSADMGDQQADDDTGNISLVITGDLYGDKAVQAMTPKVQAASNAAATEAAQVASTIAKEPAPVIQDTSAIEAALKEFMAKVNVDQPQQAAPQASTAMKAALITGLILGPVLGAAAGAGIPWLAGAYSKTAPAAAQIGGMVPTSQYDLTVPGKDESADKTEGTQK